MRSHKLTTPYSCHPVQLHKRLLCQKPCKRKRACDHHCVKPCHESCGDCTAVLSVPMPCGHVIEMQCSDWTAGTYKCTYTTQSIQLGCGHQYKVLCSGNQIGKPYCDAPCAETLPCGHNCPGKCRDCRGTSTHPSCAASCEKELSCAHKCIEA
jgi:hypothetical protein